VIILFIYITLIFIINIIFTIVYVSKLK